MSKILTLLMVLLSLSASSQNLVPNWSFEEYEDCPEGLTEITKAIGWKSFKLSPDFFHECSQQPASGVPSNALTENRPALEGGGYGGYVQFDSQVEEGEALAIELNQPLEIGTTYYVSFYVSKGRHPDSNCWSNKVGATFTTSEFEDWPLEQTIPISNSAHIVSNDLVADTSWSKIDGFFTADSAYTYLSIGNFYDISQQEIQCDSSYSSYLVYYFLDCVCVSTDQTDCDELLHLEENNIRNSIKVYPNPFTDKINFHSSTNKKVKKLELYSSTGQLILSEVVDVVNSEASISDLSKLPEGIYYLSVCLHNHQIFNYKLIKI